MRISFTDEIANKICDRLSCGESLSSICRNDGMPGFSTIFQWLGEKPAFADMYARAREAQADAIFDECLLIADEASEESERTARLRIDTRKWIAGKLRPKKYGDKLEVVDKTVLNGEGELPLAMLARKVALAFRLAAMDKEQAEPLEIEGEAKEE